MGPTVINGLPAHVLLIHVVVVLVPVAALLLALGALWPAARRRLGMVTPLVALVALAAIPPTTHAGEWLLRRVDRTALTSAHAHLADGLLPWSIGVFLVATAAWLLFERAGWLHRCPAAGRPTQEEPAPVGGGSTLTRPVTSATAAPPAPLPVWIRPARVVAVVLALVVSVGSVVQVYRIGDSGARAAWHDGYSATPNPPTSGH